MILQLGVDSSAGFQSNPDRQLLDSPLADSWNDSRIDTGGSAQSELRRSAAWRRERVAVAAYYLSEQRGFAPGCEARDWGLAESQINAIDEAES